ncbi:hypothetical protein [Sphingosinicella microcystinivorans]|uniref:hypothetical protein n=1 Tax=Sphingosinicella microcystinivorans TaxID=335406 RepID=UPI0022F38BA5|nr:hypothetical protein [Sphingosinicella microcystinivorans]WBX83858.1 hypothetical protein PE061_19055 [Sphingosinicella microcystinivorans]
MTQAPAPLSPRPATPRHDGWTPERRRVFLESLAECGVVQDACRAAGMSPASAYALRQRKSGALFALGWAAALRHARERLADELLSRALHGCTERIEKDGEVVATRHRFDNRLSMAVLTRLDREAEKCDGHSGAVTAVAEDFEALLDCVAAGDAEGEAAFVAAHRAPAESPPALPADGALMRSLAAFDRIRGYADMCPEDIDISDLDPADAENWDDDQWERAFRSGLADTMD